MIQFAHMGKRKTKYQPDIRRGIVSIFFALLGILMLLSFFNAAGTFGTWLDETVLSALFGVLKYCAPFIAFFLSWAVVKGEEVVMDPKFVIGFILLSVSFASFFNIGFDLDMMFSDATDGRGAGLIGMFAWILKNYLGMAGGVVTLAALFLVGALLAFNNPGMHGLIVQKTIAGSLSAMGNAIRSTFSALFLPSHDREDEDDDEEYDEEYDEDDEYEDVVEEPAFTKNDLSKDSDEEEDEDEEEEDDIDEDDDEEKDGPRRIEIPVEDADAGYMQHVVVKPIPPIGLLTSKKSKPTSGDIKANLRIIEDTFADFNIDVDLGETRVGPTVTQFTLKPPRGVRLSRITALTNNLALNLAAHPIRIEAPIPGTSLVGIEVPNEKAAHGFSLKEIA